MDLYAKEEYKKSFLNKHRYLLVGILCLFGICLLSAQDKKSTGALEKKKVDSIEQKKTETPERRRHASICCTQMRRRRTNSCVLTCRYSSAR